MEEIDLKELLDYFKGKIVWMIITVLLFIGIGNVYNILTRIPMYKSDTTILLVNSASTDGSYNSTELQLNKSLVGTYSEIIKSRRILDPVIKNLGLDYSYGKLKNNISVSSIANTEIIQISVGDSDPELASRIANEIASVFSIEIQKIYKLNNISVVDKAVDSVKPYNINYMKDNFIYIAAALILSFGVIFVMFYFDTTIKTSEEIENKLGLTVVGIVPKVEKEL